MPYISGPTKRDIKYVLKNYGLHGLNSFREFPLGIENPNIKVETEKGVFVLLGVGSHGVMKNHIK